MNRMITLEDLVVYYNEVLKEPVNGYSPELDSMSGSLGWSKGGEGAIIWATPTWENTTITPFDIQYPDTGDYESYCEIDFSDRPEPEQYKLYFTILVLAIEYIEKN